MNEYKINVDNLSDEEKEQLEALVAKANKTSKVWKPAKGKCYYTLSYILGVDCRSWDGERVDNISYETGNCFKTNDEATDYYEYLKIKTELERFAIEYNDRDIDWYDTTNKYTIGYFELIDDILAVEEHYKFSIPTFSSEDIAKKAIETIGAERLKRYYFGIKEKDNEKSNI